MLLLLMRSGFRGCSLLLLLPLLSGGFGCNLTLLKRGGVCCCS